MGWHTARHARLEAEELAEQRRIAAAAADAEDPEIKKQRWLRERAERRATMIERINAAMARGDSTLLVEELLRWRTARMTSIGVSTHWSKPRASLFPSTTPSMLAT